MPSHGLLSAEKSATEKLAHELEDDLLRVYGPLIGARVLYKVLGYPTSTAFRQAMVKNTQPVPVFDIERRKGKFALAKEVAGWIARQRIPPAASTGSDAVTGSCPCHSPQ